MSCSMPLAMVKEQAGCGPCFSARPFLKSSLRRTSGGRDRGRRGNGSSCLTCAPGSLLPGTRPQRSARDISGLAFVENLVLTDAGTRTRYPLAKSKKPGGVRRNRIQWTQYTVCNPDMSRCAHRGRRRFCGNRMEAGGRFVTSVLMFLRARSRVIPSPLFSASPYGIRSCSAVIGYSLGAA
ncbi:hypothetical protein K466DRAFT_223073 [Polyporus arcularius HHB13444]|uniref:Uncharacterized protein n=1 Tax=Polyporus arcularius HHB13444 TaxID=1314778 RepID=A0A5C3PX96_9APHY|nr:hypothetical protein K466DRAFT_223073 [Polyporus arcularius HHB13444]